MSTLVRPSLRGVTPYALPDRAGRDELLVDLNEGAALVDDAWLTEVTQSVGAERLRRYPDASRLESKLADRLGVGRDRVIITNGGDDAIDRICKVSLGTDDSIVLPSPSFEMIARSVILAGGRVNRVPWMGGVFPAEQVFETCDETTRCVAVVSPNNPTGGVINPESLAYLSEELPGVLLMVDLAYTEYADVDLTETALSLPNAVIVRTYSKAYGLAGLRLGYAVGSAPVINAMRAVGGPFPCSALSLAAGEAALSIPDETVRAGLERVRGERAQITEILRAYGVRALDSQANFVFAKTEQADTIWRGLADRGIRVKRFSDPALAGCLRIGCPGNQADFDRLVQGLESVLCGEGAGS